jgi:hypothetical protein
LTAGAFPAKRTRRGGAQLCHYAGNEAMRCRRGSRRPARRLAACKERNEMIGGRSCRLLIKEPTPSDHVGSLSRESSIKKVIHNSVSRQYGGIRLIERSAPPLIRHASHATFFPLTRCEGNTHPFASLSGEKVARSAGRGAARPRRQRLRQTPSLTQKSSLISIQYPSGSCK